MQRFNSIFLLLDIYLSNQKIQLLKNYKKFSATRLTQCIGSVSDLMEFAVGRLYVENFFNHQSKKAVN